MLRQQSEPTAGELQSRPLLLPAISGPVGVAFAPLGDQIHTDYECWVFKRTLGGEGGAAVPPQQSGFGSDGTATCFFAVAAPPQTSA